MVILECKTMRFSPVFLSHASRVSEDVWSIEATVPCGELDLLLVGERLTWEVKFRKHCLWHYWFDHQEMKALKSINHVHQSSIHGALDFWKLVTRAAGQTRIRKYTLPVPHGVEIMETPTQWATLFFVAVHTRAQQLLSAGQDISSHGQFIINKTHGWGGFWGFCMLLHRVRPQLTVKQAQRHLATT